MTPLMYFSVSLIAIGVLISVINFHALIHAGLFVVAALMLFSGTFLLLLALSGQDDG